MVADVLWDLKGKGVETCLDVILIYSAYVDRHFALVTEVLSFRQTGGGFSEFGDVAVLLRESGVCRSGRGSAGREVGGF